jgi:hypothetical protein
VPRPATAPLISKGVMKTEGRPDESVVPAEIAVAPHLAFGEGNAGDHGTDRSQGGND